LLLFVPFSSQFSPICCDAAKITLRSIRADVVRRLDRGDTREAHAARTRHPSNADRSLAFSPECRAQQAFSGFGDKLGINGDKQNIEIETGARFTYNRAPAKPSVFCCPCSELIEQSARRMTNEV
jgi:hypothetical protein